MSQYPIWHVAIYTTSSTIPSKFSELFVRQLGVSALLTNESLVLLSKKKNESLVRAQTYKILTSKQRWGI
jgi:hypothetical protein